MKGKSKQGLGDLFGGVFTDMFDKIERLEKRLKKLELRTRISYPKKKVKTL